MESGLWPDTHAAIMFGFASHAATCLRQDAENVKKRIWLRLTKDQTPGRFAGLRMHRIAFLDP